MASVARGNEGWPRSAARQGMAGSFGRHGGVAARRRALVAVCSSTAGSTGWWRGRSAGVRGVRTRAGRESAARPGSRRSELGSGAASARAGALECLRAQRGEGERGRERGERKGVEREKKGQRFDSVQTQNFQLKLEKF